MVVVFIRMGKLRKSPDWSYGRLNYFKYVPAFMGRRFGRCDLVTGYLLHVTD
jgi:hypothetical protein